MGSRVSVANSVKSFESLTDEQVVRVWARLDGKPRQRAPCE